ncbi:helix-turn-helix domain-containing protein [Pseudonocardia sp. WMMC193]|uniref:helix-turn-helix domain-containing protein n=1 Tax=Pseudonocardia sp. WMMC193 TaxID=2911965 RepID=UPI001F3A506A|nr:helix-turn-helix domain-containing protein [Pseudonocardia sp. WMMC193]MCF7548208.1 helix-turn-helix domain-containing protein [Pseudonocardia sp. WMMC193]
MSGSSALTLTATERAELLRLTEGSSSTALRARIVLLSAEGLSVTAVAERLGTSRPTVATWRTRYLAAGLRGLRDSSRPGRPRIVDSGAVVRTTLLEPPAVGRRWTCRGVASRLGISGATVARTWQEYGIVPLRSGAFGLAVLPALEARSLTVLGRCSGPAGEAVALSVGAPSVGAPSVGALSVGAGGTCPRPVETDSVHDLLLRVLDPTARTGRPGRAVVHVVADTRGQAELRRSPATRARWSGRPDVRVHRPAHGVGWERLRAVLLLVGTAAPTRDFCDTELIA